MEGVLLLPSHLEIYAQFLHQIVKDLLSFRIRFQRLYVGSRIFIHVISVIEMVKTGGELTESAEKSRRTDECVD